MHSRCHAASIDEFKSTMVLSRVFLSLQLRGPHSDRGNHGFMTMGKRSPYRRSSGCVSRSRRREGPARHKRDARCIGALVLAVAALSLPPAREEPLREEPPRRPPFKVFARSLSIRCSNIRCRFVTRARFVGLYYGVYCTVCYRGPSPPHCTSKSPGSN